MKFSYSLVKKLLPRVPAKAKLAEGITMHAFEVEEVKGDTLDIKLYANRYSDAASHLGIAREAAAIFGLKLKNPVQTIVNAPEGRGLVKVSVEEPALCPRYAARVFDIPRIPETPAWMKQELKTCGLKSIHAVVDVMNYVMIEVGQPLHAFDAAKIAGEETKRIIVRRAKKGEKLTTLDNQHLVLDKDVLTIADAEHSLAVAGVKGGLASGVDMKTRRFIVEAANFEPTSIYKTSRALKLPTDAALRFSHGMSPVLVGWGLDRATELLTSMGAKLLDSADVYPRPIGDELIEFSPARYATLMGNELTALEAKRRFASLGFRTERSKKNKDAFLVRVPAWRTDIEIPEDLAEEIARLRGCGALPARPPAIALTAHDEEETVRFKEKACELLVRFGLDEVYNSTFVGEKDMIVKTDTPPVEVANPIAEDKKYLRPNLAALLLRNVRDNARFADAVRIFEIGNVFGSAPAGGVKEGVSLGIALGGKRSPKLMFELKGIVDEFLTEMGLEEFDFKNEGTRLRVETDHHVIGRMELAALPKQWFAAGAEIDAGRLRAFLEEERAFRPLPKFPATMRDLSVLVERNARIGELMEEIQNATRLIQDVDLIDEWVDERLGEKQSVTFRIVFQADDRTLTDKEVNAEIEKITAALKKNFGAEIR